MATIVHQYEGTPTYGDVEGCSSTIPMETLRTQIRRMRRQDGLSQEDLGNACGMTQSAIARFETRADDDGFNIDTLRRIARALDAEVHIHLMRD